MYNSQLWYYSSRFTRKSGNEFINGHLGISFDTFDIDDDKKIIYGFLPDNENIYDNTKLFREFYNKFASDKDPLYKMDIEFNINNYNKLFNIRSTYSTPFDGYKFINYFDNLNKNNNCITFIINILKPNILSNKYPIQLKKQYDIYAGYIPGGYIRGFIDFYSEFSDKLYPN